MKVVKLNKKHRLFHEGCVVAIKFNSPWSKGAMECRTELYKIDESKWLTYRSGTNRPYWIGFKDEKMMTFLLLKADFTN